MSRALCCLGLKTESENSTSMIYVKLSKKHDRPIWVLSLSEIKRMKCDTSSPLFLFKKSFKSYWVLIQRPNAFKGVYCEWCHLEVQTFMVCATPFRGQFGGVWIWVGSNYVWEWTPQDLNLPKCNRKCYRGCTQTFVLLKVHAVMVENDTFLAKCQILAIFRKCHQVGYKTLCKRKTQPPSTVFTM